MRSPYVERMDVNELFAANIRRQRRRKGWTQEKLADETGLHRTYISGVERGVRNPTVAIVGRFAEAFGVKPADLFRE